MTSLIVFKVLGWVLPVVLGPVVYFVAREVLNVSQRIDDLPPAFKRVAVVLLGGIVTAGLNTLGIAIPEACNALAGTEVGTSAAACAQALGEKVPVQAVTAALVAMVIHAAKKSRPNA